MKTTNQYPRLFGILLALLTALPSVAQGEQDSFRINPKFLEELDNAFSIQNPISAPIAPLEAEKPDRAQLKEWVLGKEQDILADLKESIAPTAIAIPGLAGDDLKKAAYMWYSSKYKIGVLQNNPNAISGLDVKKFLSRYLTKEGRELAASRELAEKSKVKMDIAYPMFK